MSTGGPNILAFVLLLPLRVRDLDHPVVFPGLILALEPPPWHPFARGLIVNNLLAPLLVGEGRTGLGTESADALLAGEQFPFGRRFGGR